jgi:hypothetical protein
MRLIVLATAAISLAAALPAAAQHSPDTGTPMSDAQYLLQLATSGAPMNQWMATRPAKLSGMSPDAEAWLKDQVKTQAATPRSVDEVAAAIDVTLGPAIRRAAKSEGVAPRDVSLALLLKIMQDAKISLMVAARRAPDATPTWRERIAQAEANRVAALHLQSSQSLKLAMD